MEDSQPLVVKQNEQITSTALISHHTHLKSHHIYKYVSLPKCHGIKHDSARYSGIPE